MEKDPSGQVLRAEDLVPAAKEHKPNLEKPPRKTILKALVVAAEDLVVVVDRGAEFLLQVFLAIIQATINLDKSRAKGIIQIRARKSMIEAFLILHAG